MTSIWDSTYRCFKSGSLRGKLFKTQDLLSKVISIELGFNILSNTSQDRRQETSLYETLLDFFAIITHK